MGATSARNYLVCQAMINLLVIAFLYFESSGTVAADPDAVAKTRSVNEVSNLLQNISSNAPWAIDRDTNGTVVSIGIPSRYEDDHSMELLGSLCTVTQAAVFGGSKRWEQGSPILTERGITFLAGMPNLTHLELACLSHLDSGVLRGVRALGQVRHLTLYNIALARQEYRWLAYATNLTHLDIENCSSFGDQELLLLTNLIALKDLRLLGTSVSAEGTNRMSQMHALTNIVLKSSAESNTTLKGSLEK